MEDKKEVTLKNIKEAFIRDFPLTGDSRTDLNYQIAFYEMAIGNLLHALKSGDIKVIEDLYGGDT